MPERGDEATALISELRGRRDIGFTVAQEIDAFLAQSQPTVKKTEQTNAAKVTERTGKGTDAEATKQTERARVERQAPVPTPPVKTEQAKAKAKRRERIRPTAPGAPEPKAPPGRITLGPLPRAKVLERTSNTVSFRLRGMGMALSYVVDLRLGGFSDQVILRLHGSVVKTIELATIARGAVHRPPGVRWLVAEFPIVIPYQVPLTFHVRLAYQRSQELLKG